MKALILSTVLVVMADCALNHGGATTATWLLIERLVHGTARDVGESVYRQ